MTTGVSMHMYERWLKEEQDNHNETKMKLQQAELEIALLKQQLETATMKKVRKLLAMIF